MTHKARWLTPLFALSLFALPGCGSDEGDAAGSCTIADLGDGTSAIRCPDGSELVVKNGTDGKDGVDGKDGEKGDKGDKGDDAVCTLDEVDGKSTLTCGGQSVVIGDSCVDGFAPDLVIDDQSMSLALFQVTSCTWLRGDLAIEFDGKKLPGVLSRIEKVDGSVSITQSHELEEVSLPRLAEVGTDIGIVFNESIEKVSFPALKTVARSLWIVYNESLTDMDGFGALESVGAGFGIDTNPLLATLGSFDSLTKVGALNVWENVSLATLGDFPKLQTIRCEHEDCEDLGGLSIIDNDALTSLAGLSALEKVPGKVTFIDNPALPQSHVDDFIDGLDEVGETDVCGNKDGDACPL